MIGEVEGVQLDEFMGEEEEEEIDEQDVEQDHDVIPHEEKRVKRPLPASDKGKSILVRARMANF